MKPGRLRGGVWLFALFASSVVSRARAGDAPSHSAPQSAAGQSDEATNRDQADAWIREGVALRIDGREAEALERFRRAHEMVPSARALGQMGLAAKSLRLYVEAERCLDGALAEEADPWVSQNREALEQARAIVVKQLAWLVVRSNVKGAEVWINGARAGTLPLPAPIRAPAGSVLVEVRAAGYRTAETAAKLPAESTNEIVLDLRAQPTAPSRPSPAAAPPPSDATPSPLRPWIYATLALGAAGVTTGAALGGAALATKNERDEVCPNAQCPSREGVELDQDVRTYATWSTVTFSVGGSALAASLILWLVEEPASPRQATAVHLVPLASPAGGWLGVAGAF